jgi:hypothetical protein
LSRKLIVLVAGMLLLSGCLGITTEVNDSPTPTPVPAEPTPTPSPSPEPTPSPTPTATPTPTPTPVPTPTPTPTPTPEPFRSTLTGEPMPEPPLRPVAVRIDNLIPARPQSGLSDADIVYESPTEASVTRFLAIFQTTAPEVVGPVRSARLMDIDVIPLHDAMLAYSGASDGVADRMWQAGLPLLMVEGNAAAAGWRENSRFAPHNLYTSIPRLREVADGFGWMRDAQNNPFSFGDPTTDGVEATGAAIPYAAGYAEFRYNAETDSYDRYVEGIAHRDLNNGEPVSPRNVLVLDAMHVAGDVAPNQRGEVSNHVMLRGSGTGWLLRNGQLHEVEWRRDDPAFPFRFTDPATGESVPLAEGKTWICLVPQWMTAERID